MTGICKLRYLFAVLFGLFTAGTGGYVLAQNAEQTFESLRSQIFQIEVVDIASESRSAIGSGFVSISSNSIVTNYHVVSQFISKPSKYRVAMITESGDEVPVRVDDFDIINDLAILHSEQELGDPIPIAVAEPKQGAEIYSLGNPHDLGMTVVPGTYNGLTEKEYYHLIHFSGSINAGMSGGPVVNAQGALVGINVATSGNQISFLVPVEKLKDFAARREVLVKEELSEHAQSQLLKAQEAMLESFLTKPREQESLGEATVLSDIPGLVSCWGFSSTEEEEDQLYDSVTRSCRLSDRIFISNQMTTGSLSYSFEWYNAEAMSDIQLNNLLQQQMHWHADNSAGQNDVLEYRCEESITEVKENSAPSLAKSFICARQYVKFPELHDVVYFRIAKRQKSALISHFTVSGVSDRSALAFLESFTGSISWP